MIKRILNRSRRIQNQDDWTPVTSYIFTPNKANKSTQMIPEALGFDFTGPMYRLWKAFLGSSHLLDCHLRIVYRRDLVDYEFTDEAMNDPDDTSLNEYVES
jgi:hypothetical protein